ncbi:MAG: hypothetical protein HOE69_05740 [Euryarchaeota archaeon]|jgi:hypothetical protein|nr:hypothetical protein [Euryarchaeota archaeon]
MGKLPEGASYSIPLILFALALIPTIISIPILFTGPDHPEGLSVSPPENHEALASSTLLVILDGLPAYVMEDPDMMPNLVNWTSHGSKLNVMTGEITLTGACTKEMSTGRHATPIDAAKNWEVKYDGKDDPFHYAEDAGIDVAFAGFYVWTNLFTDERFEHQTVYDSGFSDVYDADNKTLAIVDKWIEEDSRGIMIAHLGGTDHAGHIWGVETEEYREKARIIDTQLEAIRTSAPDDWAVMFTADHGMTLEGGHAISTGEDAMAVNLYATGPPFIAGGQQTINQRDISSLFVTIHDLDFPVSADARIPLNVFAVDNNMKVELEQWNWNAAVERQNWLKDNDLNYVDVSSDTIDWDSIPTEPFKERWLDIFGSVAAVLGIIVIAWLNKGEKFILDRKAYVSFGLIGIIWLMNNLIYFQLYNFNFHGLSIAWFRRGFGVLLPAIATMIVLSSAFGNREKWPNLMKAGFSWMEDRTSQWFPLGLLAISLWQPDARLSPSLFCLFAALVLTQSLKSDQHKWEKKTLVIILLVSLFPIWNHISTLLSGSSLQKLTKIDYLYKFELQLVNTFMTENWIFAIALVIFGIWLSSRLGSSLRKEKWWLDASILSSVVILHAFGNSWTDRIILIAIVSCFAAILLAKGSELKTHLTYAELGTLMLIIPTWGAWPAIIVLLLCRIVVTLFEHDKLFGEDESSWGLISRFLASGLIPYFLLCLVWIHYGQLTMVGLIEFNPSKWVVTGGFFGERVDPPVIWMALMTILPVFLSLMMILHSWNRAGNSLQPLFVLLAYIFVTRASHYWMAFEHPQVLLMVGFSSFITLIWLFALCMTGLFTDEDMNNSPPDMATHAL